MDIGVTSFLTDRAMSPAALASAAEERGFSSLYLPEHTHLPLRQDEPPSLVEGVDLDDYRRSLDPLVALSAAASVTRRIRLGTGVLLVAQHDPIVLAKQLATLDHLSGGRVTIGIGYGWNRAEAEDHGVDFSRRREVADEKLGCLSALWGDDPAEFHGVHVDVPPCWASPKPLQKPRPPVLIGGAAAERLFSSIAAHADGWMPIGGAGLSSALPSLRRAMEKAGRDPSSVHVVPFGTIADAGKLAHLAEMGATEVVLRVPAGDASGMERRLDELSVHVGRY